MNINVSGIARTVGRKVAKHLPDILLGLGIGGGVVSTVMACKETTRLSGVMDDIRDDIAEVHARREVYSEEEYTKKQYMKDLTKTYGRSAGKLAKLYAPSIAVGSASIAATVVGHNIQAGRLAASIAASDAALLGLNSYRENVREEFGEDVDKRMRFGIKEETYDIPVMDKNGNPKLDKNGHIKTKKETIETLVAVPLNSGDTYAIFSKDTSTEYVVGNDEYNLFFLLKIQDYFNSVFNYKKPIFLNDVYDRLGLPRTAAGQVIGWSYETGKEINFGIGAKYDSEREETYYILDFNVDPVNLLDKMWEEPAGEQNRFIFELCDEKGIGDGSYRSLFDYPEIAKEYFKKHIL